MTDQRKEFGLCNLVKEGEAIHPDDIDNDLTDEQYVRQARAYRAWSGRTGALVRDWLRPEIESE